MRVSLPVVLALAVVGGVTLFALGDDQTGDGAGESDLVVEPEVLEPEREPAPERLTAPGREGSGLPPIEVTLIDEIPAGIAAHFEAGGHTAFEELELREQIVRFEIDPDHMRFLTGEDLLRSISELRGVDKPLRFLKSEDLDRFRKHVFGRLADPRWEAAELIDLFHPMGFRVVAWEGEFYVAPHGGHRMPSAPVIDANDPREPR